MDETIVLYKYYDTVEKKPFVLNRKQRDIKESIMNYTKL